MSDPRIDGDVRPEEYVPAEWTLEHDAEGLDEEAEKAETVLSGVDRAADVTERDPNPADDQEVDDGFEAEEDFPRESEDDFPREEDPRLINEA